MSSQDIWYKTARTIVKAGYMPFPISGTLIELLKILITERQAEFIQVFKKQPNLTLDQIKENCKLKEEEIKQILNDLMHEGVITGTESRSAGVMIYRLMPPFPGLFEFTLMRGKSGEKEKKLAKLFDTLFEEIKDGTQKNYNNIVKQFKQFPAIDRVVPVEQEVEVQQELVLPPEEVSKIVEEYDDIALTTCYCRHEKDLLDRPCEVTDIRKNCLLFGKTAKFAIEQEFAESISRDEVKKILKEAEEEGLVHKTFHVHLKPERGIEAICNCCKCCCGIFQLYYQGAMPLHTLTSYIAEINEEDCVGCGVCVEKCPMETIDLVDDIAIINTEKCIGCGACVHQCPSDAIELNRTGLRDVYVPPPKLDSSD